MRWSAVSGAVIISLASIGEASASALTGSGPGLPCWSALVIPVTLFGAILLWHWWVTPPPGVAFDPDDPEKNAAIQEAQRTLPLFWRAFDNPAPDETDFSLKFNLTPHKTAEFIWAHDLKRENGCIYGKLDNEPLEPGYSPDRYYEIDPDDIVDWAYLKGNVAQGHFLTRVMFKAMPRRFVKSAERALGWA